MICLHICHNTYNVNFIFYRGQYISVYVGFDDDKKEQEQQSRMPILLHQSQGMLQVGLFVFLIIKNEIDIIHLIWVIQQLGGPKFTQF